MVMAGAAPCLTPFRTHSLSFPQKGLPLLNLHSHGWQFAMMDTRVVKSSLLKETFFCPGLHSDKKGMHSLSPIEKVAPFATLKSTLVFKSSRRLMCRSLLEGSDRHDNALDSVSNDQRGTFDGQESVSEQLLTASSSKAVGEPMPGTDNKGRMGLVSFFPDRQFGSSPLQKEEPQIRSNIEGGDAWVSVLWVLGPAVLVSSVVLPPFFLRKIFEMILEDSLVTDFLILFFTETLFYAGVFAFLLVAHKVQQATGILTWNSGSQSSLGYKLSQYATMALAVFLPVGAFAIVWPWTGPAAAAALLPYIAGLAVQYGFEQVVQEKKWSVWPLIPIIFQVYRLHQLNRATQLVAGLLYSLRGAEATAETLAVNGSLQTLVTVLQLLGMLCLWALAAYLTHAFSSEAQGWQSRPVS